MQVVVCGLVFAMMLAMELWQHAVALADQVIASPAMQPVVEFARYNPLIFGYALGVCIGVLFFIILPWLFCGSRNKRGYGSGENNRWNRRIRTDRPKFVSKHYKLQHIWQYKGAGSKVDMSVVKRGVDGAISAHDSSTGYPLSGHLIGRQTWEAELPDTGLSIPRVLTSDYMATHDAYSSLSAKGKAGARNAELQQLKKEQDALTFDPSVNINSGDKILRNQLLGNDPVRGKPKKATSAEDALEMV